MTRASLRHRLVPALSLSLAAACGGASPHPVHPTPGGLDHAAGVRTPALAALLDESWEADLRDDPFLATMLGDHRFDDQVVDLSQASVDRARARSRDELARARALEASLDPADRVTWRLFVEEHESEVALEVCESHLWNDSPMSNLITGLNQVAQIHQVDSAASATAYVARMRGFAVMFDQDAANLRAGVAQGRVAPRATLERLVTLADRTLAQPFEEWTCAAIPLASSAALGDQASSFAAELRAAVEEDLRPAIQRYRDALANDVIPHARDAEHEGVASLPDGAACYEANIRAETTTTRTASELHALGESEIARTDAQLVEIGGRLFPGETTLEGVLARMRGDTTLGYASSDAILEDARARVAAGEARAPELFSHPPSQHCDVVAMPPAEAESAPFAYYVPGAEDGSRGGMFFVNTATPEARRRYSLASLTAHEAVPGHHFQISVAQHLPDMPAFRRHGGFTAYVEGWGLYAERLADEMGLYHDDLDRIGAVDLEAFRAARLVVDTGLHAQGWSRGQAEAYMHAHTAMPDDLIRNEVDRYLNTPGQALAYKVGQLEILALRDEARQALGERFDLRAFHDVVLGVGAVSLPVLDEAVRSWIAAQR